MDYFFTQKELSYLDDIMPEHVKRSKEDRYGGDDDECKDTPIREIVSVRNLQHFEIIHSYYKSLLLLLIEQ